MKNNRVFWAIAFIVFMLQGNFLHAQDLIIKKDGEVIRGKVLEVTPELITYKKQENLKGPNYSIIKADLSRIEYKNGIVDDFASNEVRVGFVKHGRGFKGPKERAKKLAPKKNNNIAFAPVQFTENVFGFGLSYEKSIGKGTCSFYLPAMYTFHAYFPKTSTSNDNSFSLVANPMFYVAPGIKIYTNFNKQSRVKWAVTPTIVYAIGKHWEPGFDYINNVNTVTYQNRQLLGALINFGANFYPSRHVYGGFDLGLGTSFLNRYGNENRGNTILFQSSFRIGYRFAKKEYTKHIKITVKK